MELLTHLPAAATLPVIEGSRLPVIDVLASRFRVVKGMPINSWEEAFPEGPLLLSLAEFAALTGCGGEEIPANLHQFKTLRAEKNLGLPEGRDDYWGLMDFENALVTYYLVRASARAAKSPYTVLITGTGVGLLEELLASIPEVDRVISVDITNPGEGECPHRPLDDRQASYQVKAGQRAGMHCTSPKIELVRGDAQAYLDETEETFGAIIRDDNHRVAQVWGEVEAITTRDRLQIGGVLVFDNFNQVPTNPGPTMAALEFAHRFSRTLNYVSERGGFATSCAFYINEECSEIGSNILRSSQLD